MSSQSPAESNSEAQARDQSSTDSDENSASETSATDPKSRTASGKLDLPIETNPTVRPILVWMATTLVLAIGLIGYVSSNVDSFGGTEITNLIIQVIGVVTVLLLIRFTIKAFVLTRTTYHIGRRHVSRRYSLLFRAWEQTIPTSMIRSSELRQSRVQKLLGYGTIEINRGLGDVRLENVESPTELREVMQEIIIEQTDSNG